MAPGRRLENSSRPSGPSLQDRQAQSARDKKAHQLRLAAASIASIPKGPAQKKEQLFTRGALKSFQFAPRGHGYYDAFVQKPDTACVTATTGPATVVSGYSSDTVAAADPVTGVYPVTTDGVTIAKGHTGSATLVIFNPGSSGHVVGEILTLAASPTGDLEVKSKEITCTQFTGIGNVTGGHGHYDLPIRDPDVNNYDHDPTRQVEQIPLRGSLRIRNITESLSVGGVVRMLRYNGGFHLMPQYPTAFGDDKTREDSPDQSPHPDTFLRLCAMVRDAPRTKVFSGHELMEMHQVNTYPADFVRSMAFESSRTFRAAVAAPAYCNLLILIDDFVSSSSLVNNTYEINVMVHRAARFGIGTLLHSMSRDLRVKPPSQAQQDHQEESSKPTGQPVRPGLGTTR